MLGKGHGGIKRLQRREKTKGEEGDRIKFIDLIFEIEQVAGFGKERRRQDFHGLHVLGMNDDLWDRVSEGHLQAQ